MCEPVYFDLETYADKSYSLTRLSEVQYILDPRFELLSVAAAVDGRVRVWRGDSPEWLAQFRRWDAEGRRFVAHHARFDLRVLALRLDFRPQLVGDTCSVARYFWFAEHGLDTLSQQLFHMGKQGQPLFGKHLRDFTPAEWAALARYNAADTVLCGRLWNALVPHLPAGELELIQQTLKIQLTPHRIDKDSAVQLIARSREQAGLLEAERPAIAQLANRPKALKAHLKTQYAVEVVSIDKKRIGNVDRFGPDAGQFLRDLIRSKELKKVAKDVEALQSRMGIAPGLVLIDLNYSGAHSHRWTSGGAREGSGSSFNYQNLSKGTGIRELNIPREGYCYVMGDLSQIEARVTAWLAGEDSQLDAFRSNRDLYLEFAEPLFGRKLAKADKLERGIGKAAVLGLGFGMGAKLFAERLKADAPQGLQLLQERFGVDSPQEAATRVVNQYRDAYPRIHGNAGAMFRAFEAAVRDTSGRPIMVGRWITIVRQGADVVVKLPTGGFLTYKNVGLTERATPYGSKFVPTYLNRPVSFSMPVENAVQSIARDIFARSLLALEAAGFPISFHVHDEAIAEVSTADAAERLPVFEQILGADDPRCPGLPVACEAFLSDRYTKNEGHMRQFTEKLRADEGRCDRRPAVIQSGVSTTVSGEIAVVEATKT